jgi:hypothetical protein
MFKDVQIALSMAEEFGVELPETAAFAGTAMAGVQKGWADLDFSSIARHYGFSHEDNVLPDTLFVSAKAKSGEDGMGAAEKEKKKGFLFFGRRS